MSKHVLMSEVEIITDAFASNRRVRHLEQRFGELECQLGRKTLEVGIL